MVRRLLATTAAGAVIALMAGSAGAQQLNYSSGVVFGDSLSDTDNFARFISPALRPGAPYVNGRFSNGPLWLETLSQARGLPIDSRAFGGAQATRTTLTDLTAQVTGYLATNPSLPADRLVGIWIGGNDYISVLSSPTPPSQAQVQSAIQGVATAVGTQAGRLYAAGARNFLFVNLPPLGAIPLTSGLPAQTRADANTVSDLHSAALANVAGSLRANGANVTLVDVNGLFRDLAARPAAYGFTNVTIPCFAPVGPGGSLVATGACATPQGAAGTVFFDALHPTTAAHAIVGQFVDATLSASFEAPSAIGTTTQLGIRQFEMANQAIASRMAGARTGLGSVNGLTSAEAGADGRYGLFTFGTYVDGEQDQASGQYGFEYEGYTLGAGIDYQVDEHLTAGIAFSYGDAELETDGALATVDGQAYSVLTYATAAAGPLWFDGWLGYSFGQYDISRQTRFAPAPVAEGSPDAHTYGGGATVGYAQPLGGLSIGPFAGLRYANIEVDGYEEEGSPLLRLAVQEFDAESLVGALGLSAAGRFGGADSAIIPTVRVAYEREFQNDGRKVFATLPSNQPSFSDAGSGKRNRVVGGVGLTVETAAGLSASIGYDGQFSGGRDEHGFSGRIGFKF